MQLVRSISDLRSWRQTLAHGSRLGFVPTMGALHEGHLSLVRASRKQCSHTIVSIFVNPLQFGPGEDLSRYPRPFDRDCELLKKEGVDIVFVPDAIELYPSDASTYIIEDKVSAPLCGQYRPGHFRGVMTVVLKLFNLTEPHFAFFGQKDAQQCAALERMVRDLNLPLTIIRCPIVREPDGLAMSSRNIYLSQEERAKAPLIYQGLGAAAQEFANGNRTSARLIAIGRSALDKEPLFNIQYWQVCHPSTMTTLAEVGSDGALMAVAVFLGTTRLIDNWVLGADEQISSSKHPLHLITGEINRRSTGITAKQTTINAPAGRSHL